MSNRTPVYSPCPPSDTERRVRGQTRSPTSAAERRGNNRSNSQSSAVNEILAVIARGEHRNSPFTK